MQSNCVRNVTRTENWSCLPPWLRTCLWAEENTQDWGCSTGTECMLFSMQVLNAIPSTECTFTWEVKSVLFLSLPGICRATHSDGSFSGLLINLIKWRTLKCFPKLDWDIWGYEVFQLCHIVTNLSSIKVTLKIRVTELKSVCGGPGEMAQL